MAARHGYGVDCFGSQFCRKAWKFSFRQPPEIVWIFDSIQQRRLG
jgi:hypothetical protein